MIKFNEYSNYSLSIRKSIGGIRDEVHEDIEIVGQEKYGKLLFTSNCTFKEGDRQSDSHKELHVVSGDQNDAVANCSDLNPVASESRNIESKFSCIGIYNTFNSNVTILYRHENNANIVAATINEQCTLLAFTYLVSSEDVKTVNYGERLPKGMFNVMVAEIEPQRTIYNLNLDRPNYIKANFLHTLRDTKEEQLLVCLHREAIAVYYFKLSQANSHLVLSDHPVIKKITEPPFGSFLWCQWDVFHQRLYVVHNRVIDSTEDNSPSSSRRASRTSHNNSSPSLVRWRKQSNKDGRSPVSNSETHIDNGDSPNIIPKHHKTILTCFQFRPGLNHNNIAMMECPLRITMPELVTSAEYLNTKPCTVIPDDRYNMKVITHSNGNIYLCVQSIPSRYQSTENGDVKLSYQVVIIHHNKVLKCVCPKITGSHTTLGRLYFTLLDDYILVYMPGQFTHLINAAIDVEPCHHIMSHEGLNHKPSEAVDTLLSYLVVDHKLGHGLFDPTSGIAYKMSIKSDQLVDMFKKTHCLSQRLAILHYFLLKKRDDRSVKQIFKVLMQDVTSPDLHDLLSEYLIGNTYCAMRLEVDKDTLVLLPFTVVQTSKGFHVKDVDGTTVAVVTYSSFKEAVTFCEHAEKRDVFWSQLYNHIHWMYTKQPFRFNLKTVNEARSLQDLKPDISGHVSNRNRVVSSIMNIFGRFSSKESPQPPRVRGVDTNLPEFLRSAGTDGDEDKLISVSTEMLRDHLCQYNPNETKSKASQESLTYVKAQLEQTRGLFEILWSTMGQRQDNPHMPLCRSSDAKEYKFFHAIERLYLAATELAFPLTTSFKDYFTTLGFRCLKFSVFLQYVRRSVFNLSLQFVQQVFDDLPNNEENIVIKLELITCLSKSDALSCIEGWNHPMRDQYICRQYVSQALSDIYNHQSKETSYEQSPGARPSSQSFDTGSVDMSEANDDGGAIFPPLNAFMMLLESRDGELARRHSIASSLSQYPVDSRLLRQTAMYYIGGHK